AGDAADAGCVSSACAVAIAGGEYHTCAILGDGTAACWGEGSAGQLGTGASIANTSTPQHVAGVTEITAIAAGVDHTCALRADGSVWCWGELGVLIGNNGYGPGPIPGLPKARALSAGADFSCAV